MKNLLEHLFILLTFTVSLASCHSGYEEKDGKIYYKWIHGGNWTRENTLVSEADATTFTRIKQDLNINLGKDKKHVFKDASILEHADPNTFEQVWRDKNNVYLIQFGGTECRIKYADPKTFKVNKGFLWSQDKNNVYYKFDNLQEVDPKSFVALSDNWGKDNRHYYYHNLRVDSIDYESAEIVYSYFIEESGRPSDYIKDKNHVFFQNRLVKDANPLTFVADGVGTFGHDDKYMFSWETNKGPITEQYKKTYIDTE